MQRIEYNRYGGPDVMRLGSATPAKPKAQEVLVRIHAASVNPFDWKLRAGELKMFTGSKFPRGMGSDFSGTVESIGSRVAGFKVGDPVVGSAPMKTSGAFALLVITAEKLLVKKPASLSYAEAAVVPIPGVTAWLALVKTAKLRRGQRIFLNGALGAVGRAAIGIAEDIGAGIAGSVSAQAIDDGAALGLAPAVNYRQPIPSELFGQFDVVFDCNGSLSAQVAARLVKRGGLIIDINLTGQKLWRALISPRRKLVFFNGKSDNLAAAVDLAARGVVRIPIGRQVSLDHAIDAITKLEHGDRSGGKTVIVFDS